MLSYRLGTVNDFHWEFKPVLSYSKPHTFSTFFGEEKERKNVFYLSKPIRQTVYVWDFNLIQFSFFIVNIGPVPRPKNK